MPRLRQALATRRSGIPPGLVGAAVRGTRMTTRVRLRPGRRTGIGALRGVPALLRLRTRRCTGIRTRLRTRRCTGIRTGLRPGVPVRLRLRTGGVRARLRLGTRRRPRIPALLRRPGVPALVLRARRRTRIRALLRRTVRTRLRRLCTRRAGRESRLCGGRLITGRGAER
ncbi:hypothetical protein AB0C14_24235 [Microbispora hainanensis]|uniref:hypothetical protein n=1 Tax=Microbispora hainanensis TaxID=568844 RepID=UPI00340F5AE1